MNTYEFQSRVQGHTHHHAVFTMSDGSTVEGYMQPNDKEYVYLTKLDGTSGGKLAIADIKSVEFPDG